METSCQEKGFKTIWKQEFQEEFQEEKMAWGGMQLFKAFSEAFNICLFRGKSL